MSKKSLLPIRQVHLPKTVDNPFEKRSQLRQRKSYPPSATVAASSQFARLPLTLARPKPHQLKK